MGIRKFARYPFYFVIGLFVFISIVGIISVNAQKEEYRNLHYYRNQIDSDNQKFTASINVDYRNMPEEQRTDYLDKLLLDLDQYNSHYEEYRQFLDKNKNKIFNNTGQELRTIDNEISSLQLTRQGILLAKESLGENDIADNGDFKLAYKTIQNPDYSNLEKWVRDSGIFEGAVENLNSQFKLPYDIGINLAECGVENAFYSNEDRSITICYELISDFADMAGTDAKTDEQLSYRVSSSTTFALYHEIAHAMIDAYKLPVLGSEEDAADRFSAVILSGLGSNGEIMTLNAAESFGISAKGIRQLAFWDEHPLNQQRLHNLACLIYGKEPGKYGKYVNNPKLFLYLPKERRNRCPDEYVQTSSSWNELLRDYKKN